jgi:hypothetical protein
METFGLPQQQRSDRVTRHSFSVRAVRVGRHALAAIAPLKPAKVGLIDVSVMIEITAVASGTHRNARAGCASRENGEIRVVHVTIMIEVGPDGGLQP